LQKVKEGRHQELTDEEMNGLEAIDTGQTAKAKTIKLIYRPGDIVV
jgi:hypothetical protein